MAGKIFINYRRGDDPGNVGRLYDRLLEAFDSAQLFMDVDSFAPGIDFVRDMEKQIADCDVLLALIGKGWIDARDATGSRRLDSADDFVRIEIELALNQGKRVIPVLVGEAKMPGPEDLPDTLKQLARRNAMRLTHERFRADAEGLIKALHQALDEAEVKRQTKAESEAAEERANAERAAEEQARLTAIAGLSPLQITKAEELANWYFIKESTRQQDFRDHLARFPGGVCERMAQAKLEALVWAALGEAPDRTALTSYMDEFPDGGHLEEARSRLAWLDRADAERAARLRFEAQLAFEAAKRNDHADAIAGFLAAFPASDFAEEARRLHAALAVRDQLFEKAIASGDPQLLKAFLATYPAGFFSDQVRRRLRRLESPAWWVSKPALIGGAVIFGVVIAIAIGTTTQAPSPAPPIRKAPAPVKTIAILSVAGPQEITFKGPQGGPFGPAGLSLQLRATGSSIRWSMAGPIPDWLSVAPDRGDVTVGTSAEIAVKLTPPAQALGRGSYDGRLVFRNETSGTTIIRAVHLVVSGASCAVSIITRAAEPLSSTEECALKPQDVFKECAKCPEMVVVPAGEFWMGSPEGQGYGYEHPRHQVKIAKPFAVGKFEVTWDEWEACVAARGCDGRRTGDMGWGKGRRPVINVSWDEAKAYVAWLSRVTDKPYRLLSEAEWEYAARASYETVYAWGDMIGKNNANCRGCGSEWDGKQTAPVGSFAANRFGLYDMHGNV